MEKINQADAHHRAAMKLREAQLEQQDGHLDNSIPCGVVLLQRPCVTIEEWQAQVAKAEAEEKQQIEAGTAYTLPMVEHQPASGT